MRIKTYKNKKNILSSQSIEKRKKRIPIKILLICPILLFGTVFSFYKIRNFSSSTKSNVTFTISYNNQFSLNQESKIKINSIILDALNQTDNINLYILAKKIQNILSLEYCHLFWSKPNKILISAQNRQPILITQADRLRYISHYGQIYGQAQPETTMPTLEGVFSEAKKFKITPDNTVLLTEKENNIILEAISLYNTLKSTFKISLIKYDPFLGFTIFLADQDLKIAFGNKPFNNKLKKLKNVLENLKQNNMHPDTIELDYFGKAFVKEKRL